MKLYKVLHEDGSTCHGGIGIWPLPKNGKPGAWLSVKGKLVPCSHGLHLCRSTDLIDWIGQAIWEVEHKGKIVEGNNKVVVRKARLLKRLEAWNDRTARLFACECAERALSRIEHPDKRMIGAINMSRAYADGRVSKNDLAAAWAAAWAAERDWQSKRLIEMLGI